MRGTSIIVGMRPLNQKVETVLVLEGDAELLELLEIVLSRDGYRVIAATSGNAGLQTARSDGPVDALVSAIDLPDMRGEEVASFLGSLFPQMVAIMVMNSLRPSTAVHSHVIIQKPFTPAQLCQAIRGALDNRAGSGNRSGIDAPGVCSEARPVPSNSFSSWKT